MLAVVEHQQQLLVLQRRDDRRESAPAGLLADAEHGRDGRQEEAAAAVAPLSVMLIAFYIVGQGGAESTLGTILAYVPFASPMIMPSRIALGVSSPFEIAASLTIGVATVLLVGRVSAMVYRRAIVRTGRRLKLRDVLRPVPS